MTSALRHDPKLDLVLERTVDVPPGLVWECWTVPEHLMKWFTPKPWRTTECEIDLRPGGIFRTKMEGPNGEHGGGSGCVLEVVPSRRFVWTGALGPGAGGERHALHGHRHPFRRGRRQSACRHGLPPRLGRSIRPAGRTDEGDELAQRVLIVFLGGGRAATAA